MPGPRSPCQDIFRSSLPWQGTRRLPVICSLPSLLQYPLYLASLVQVCWTQLQGFSILSRDSPTSALSTRHCPQPGKTTRKCWTLPWNTILFPVEENYFHVVSFHYMTYSRPFSG